MVMVTLPTYLATVASLPMYIPTSLMGCCLGPGPDVPPSFLVNDRTLIEIHGIPYLCDFSWMHKAMCEEPGWFYGLLQAVSGPPDAVQAHAGLTRIRGACRLSALPARTVGQ